ncbi:MAG: Uma2 family endonuclease [Cyanobacteria bacterium P01_A01_bin.137]
MVQELSKQALYPDSDGQPMADNTQQFRWIVTIKENLERLYAARDDVFVAGDLLWYPVEGEPKIRLAPDTLVVFGRPKGDRGSYRQWLEGNVPPQVVFEILSPGNRTAEMLRKQKFYERYGVEEYYIFDPDNWELTGLLRQGDALAVIDNMKGWISPRLQIRFEPMDMDLQIYCPNGRRFLTYGELGQQVDQLGEKLSAIEQQMTVVANRNQQLEAKLREMGIDPNDV